MKVAFISQPFEYVKPPVQAGSIPIWTYRVMTALANQACDFIVYARAFPDLPSVEWHNGVQYRRVAADWDEKLARPLKLAERMLKFPQPKRPFFATSLNYKRYIHHISRDLQKQQVDIVHIHNFSQFAPVVRAYNPNVKIVLHMHCEWLSQLNEHMIDRRLQTVDLIIGCSDYITQKIKDRFPQHASRCCTVYNGVDVTTFDTNVARANAQDARLLFVGRVSPEKGVHALLDAMEQIIAHYPDAHLEVVGSPGDAPYEYMVLISDDPKVKALSRFYGGPTRHGDYMADLRARMSPEVASRVNFVGPVPHEQIVSYYHNADILINPSLSEAFGMSLVEAMVCRKPVVATETGGMPEIVAQGVTGLLVTADSASALAEAIIHLLASPETRQQMGQAGYQKAVHLYDWHCIADSLWQAYNELAGYREPLFLAK